MKLKSLALVCFVCVAMAQGWGRREAMRPWLQGRFVEADQQFARMKRNVPILPVLYLWEAEFEIERANFGMAAALIRTAKGIETADSRGLPERRLARLLLSAGQFAEAERKALEGRRWDGTVANLKIDSAMDLVTLGEVALFRGDYSTAIAILQKAKDRAKNVSSLDGLEWVRAQVDIAFANIALGLLPAASDTATQAYSAAEREWGTGSIPAMDALDSIGLVKLAEGDLMNAEVSLMRSRQWRETTYGGDNPKVAESYLHSALLASFQNDNAKAIRLVADALEIEKAKAVGPNGRWALAMLAGAEILAKAGQAADAKATFESAIPALEMELGQDVPTLQKANKQLRDLR